MFLSVHNVSSIPHLLMIVNIRRSICRVNPLKNMVHWGHGIRIFFYLLSKLRYRDPPGPPLLIHYPIHPCSDTETTRPPCIHQSLLDFLSNVSVVLEALFLFLSPSDFWLSLSFLLFTDISSASLDFLFCDALCDAFSFFSGLSSALSSFLLRLVDDFFDSASRLHPGFGLTSLDSFSPSPESTNWNEIFLVMFYWSISFMCNHVIPELTNWTKPNNIYYLP